LTEQFHTNYKLPPSNQCLARHPILNTIGAKQQHNMCGASTRDVRNSNT